MEKSKGRIAGFFGGIGRFFRGFGEAVAKGDLFVKQKTVCEIRPDHYIRSAGHRIQRGMFISVYPEVRYAGNSEACIGV